MRIGSIFLVVISAILLHGTRDKADFCNEPIKYTFFDVTGRTSAEIRTSLLENGPVDQFGIHRYAYTKWKISWNWLKNKDGSNNYSNMKLKCDIEILLPKLKDSDSIDSALIKKWNVMIRSIYEHELNHANYVLKEGARIPVEINRGVDLNSFDANQIGFNILRRIRKHDRDYDLSTKHGLTEGISVALLE